MATLNPTIFRAYDVRGVYPDDFDAAFAQRLGDRVAAWLNPSAGGGAIVVGRDARASSDELAYALIDGAVHAGARVIDVGVLSTPQFYWAIRSMDAAGGVMVTASHNPIQYNGFKVIANHGDILEVVGGHSVRQVYDSHGHSHRPGGNIEYRDVTADYAAVVAYAAGWEGGTELRVSVDAPDSVLAVLKRFGPIAPDHGLVAKFDADGDRISLFDDGQLIPADFIFLLLAEQLKLMPLVFDGRFSRTVKMRLRARNIPFTVSKVGRLYLTDAMHRTGAALGGEISGHYYWKETGGMECPELTLLRLYAIMRSSGKMLSELVAPYRMLHKSDEISIPVRDRKEAAAMLHTIEAHFHDATVRHDDGLTVEYDDPDAPAGVDWWFNIRLSNTEPVLRLIVEAQQKNLLDRRIKEILAVAGHSSSTGND